MDLLESRNGIWYQPEPDWLGASQKPLTLSGYQDNILKIIHEQFKDV